MSIEIDRTAPNKRMHPTALRARKAAASRASSVLSSKVAHAESARRVMRDRSAEDETMREIELTAASCG